MQVGAEGESGEGRKEDCLLLLLYAHGNDLTKGRLVGLKGFSQP